jgi:hypothetical protein
MSLKDDLRDDTNKPPWQICGVRWALSLAEGNDKIALESAINNRGMSGDKIADAVRKHLSLNLSGESVRRHRRGACRCPQ